MSDWLTDRHSNNTYDATLLTSYPHILTTSLFMKSQLSPLRSPKRISWRASRDGPMVVEKWMVSQWGWERPGEVVLRRLTKKKKIHWEAPGPTWSYITNDTGLTLYHRMPKQYFLKVSHNAIFSSKTFVPVVILPPPPKSHGLQSDTVCYSICVIQIQYVIAHVLYRYIVIAHMLYRYIML